MCFFNFFLREQGISMQGVKSVSLSPSEELLSNEHGSDRFSFFSAPPPSTHTSLMELTSFRVVTTSLLHHTSLALMISSSEHVLKCFSPLVCLSKEQRSEHVLSLSLCSCKTRLFYFKPLVTSLMACCHHPNVPNKKCKKTKTHLRLPLAPRARCGVL